MAKHSFPSEDLSLCTGLLSQKTLLFFYGGLSMAIIFSTMQNFQGLILSMMRETEKERESIQKADLLQWITYIIELPWLRVLNSSPSIFPHFCPNGPGWVFQRAGPDWTAQMMRCS